jgi:hypothetical protein
VARASQQLLLEVLRETNEKAAIQKTCTKRLCSLRNRLVKPTPLRTAVVLLEGKRTTLCLALQ